ncbi:MAG: antibiotic biosynthesis monooxygenase [Proteobacteria bacterium]|nr:MAG: antibiotic biosynthesis monooxygenase [Pseudomonadota bacterium]
MSTPAVTPEPPYFAVIFTSLLEENAEGYEETAERMMELAALQEGFLGIESARDEIGITVSYWRDEASIREWRAQAAHVEARRMGRELWYRTFRVRVSRVEREYGSP